MYLYIMYIHIKFSYIYILLLHIHMYVGEVGVIGVILSMFYFPCFNVIS